MSSRGCLGDEHDFPRRFPIDERLDGLNAVGEREGLRDARFDRAFRVPLHKFLVGAEEDIGVFL